MKRLFHKRIIAYFLDIWIFFVFFELIRNYIEVFITITDSWGYFIVVAVPLCIRDLVFRNSSIGKKIMGLIVVNANWTTPDVLTVIKRTTVTASLGYMLLFRLRALNEDWETALFAELEWEYTRLKTRVVEKEVYKKLQEEASINKKIDVDAMNRLYDQYLYG